MAPGAAIDARLKSLGDAVEALSNKLQQLREEVAALPTAAHVAALTAQVAAALPTQADK